MQAPAANHKETADTMLETFGLSNISPQVGKGFNRSANDACPCPWSLFTHERMAIALASIHCSADTQPKCCILAPLEYLPHQQKAVMFPSMLPCVPLYWQENSVELRLACTAGTTGRALSASSIC